MEVIYDDKLQPIGKIIENSSLKEAFTWNGKYVGKYDKNSDQTFGPKCEWVGKGDRLLAMIYKYQTI